LVLVAALAGMRRKHVLRLLVLEGGHWKEVLEEEVKENQRVELEIGVALLL
jgi:hypothetical protein